MKRKRGIKVERKAPMSPNKVRLFNGDGYTVWWKGRARPKRPGAVKPSRPRAKGWANLVVYLDDPAKRKRSFHVSWNGERFNDTPEADLLRARELAIYRDVKWRLTHYNERIIKPQSRRNSWS